jgi:hypothetical protein
MKDHSKNKRFFLVACCASLFLSGIAWSHPIITEVCYDVAGNDNGYEWVEICNPTFSTIDLSDYSIAYGGNDYTYGVLQLSGSIAPGDFFVVGGTNSDASNGSPVFDLALDFSPDLQNSGTTADGISLFALKAESITSTSVPVDVVIYGGTNGNGLIDESGSPGVVDVGDAVGGEVIVLTESGWEISNTLTPGTGPAFSIEPPIISEVFYDHLGAADDGYEWVELYNPNRKPLLLTGVFSLGYGGSNYTFGTLDLVGIIPAGGYFVVGGPLSESSNGFPVYDQKIGFNPILQNSGGVADGIALFVASAAAITSTSVPVDAVIYGTSNDNGLIDETGSPGMVNAPDVAQGNSIALTIAEVWEEAATLTPGSGPDFGGLSVSVEGWRELYFMPADLMNPALEDTLWGDDADPDGDGLVNLLECALQSHPLEPSPEAQPQISIEKRAEGSFVIVQFRVPLPVGDVRYWLETSDSLGNWTNAGFPMNISALVGCEASAESSSPLEMIAGANFARFVIGEEK